MNIRYLILALTKKCNLACAYCYHGESDDQSMKPETLRQALALASSGQGPLHVQITGGEPLLEPGLLCLAVEETLKFKRETTVGLQTNGTLMTPQWVDFLKDHKVQVGLSLDGPPAINEKLRGRTNELLRGISYLEAGRLPFTVTTVVSDLNAGHLSGIPLLLSGYSQAVGFGLDLLVSKGRGLVQPANRNDFINGLRDLMKTLEQINQRRTVPIIFRELESLAAGLRIEQPVFCHACHCESLAVHPDGNFYPCGQALGDATFVSQNLDGLQDKFSILNAMNLAGKHCRDCELEGRCPGDCPSRLYYNQGQPGLACDLYRTLYKFI